MEKKKDTHTHSMMPKKLAEALMEAGVQHFALGGEGGGIIDATFGSGGTQGAPVGGTFGQLMGYNQFRADTPGYTAQPNLPNWIDTHNIRQTGIYSQQQNLANALLQQSMGRDPQTGLPVQSLAEKQLANTTGQNAAMQQGLMGSQRGANANPALMARQAARVGAGVQQQGVGQAAALRAGEQLNAQTALGQQLGTMGNQSIQAQGGLQGALAAQNTAAIQAQLGAQNINANVYGQNAQQSGNIIGGLMNSGSQMMSSFGGMFMNQGGQIPGYANGGMAYYPAPQIQIPGLIPFKNWGSVNPFATDKEGAKKPSNEPGYDGMGMAGGPGDTEGMPSMGLDTMMAAQGGAVPFSRALVQGGYVPGQAQVNGDSQSNDTVPALLSPGEIVLPRSVTKSSNPDKAAVEFLQALRAKKSNGGYGDVVQARKMNKGGRC